jgi:hypothetical protein
LNKSDFPCLKQKRESRKPLLKSKQIFPKYKCLKLHQLAGITPDQENVGARIFYRRVVEKGHGEAENHQKRVGEFFLLFKV